MCPSSRSGLRETWFLAPRARKSCVLTTESHLSWSRCRKPCLPQGELLIMRSHTARLFLALLVLACPRFARAQDSFGNGDGHFGQLLLLGEGAFSVNTSTLLTADAAAGATTVTVAHVTGFADGDLVMLWRAAGYLPAPASGNQSAIDLSMSGVGRYELARVSISGANQLALTAPLQNAFAATLTQVVRIPEFNNVIISPSARLVPEHAWDGSTGGIVAFFATGAVTVNGGRVSATGYGFPRWRRPRSRRHHRRRQLFEPE